MFRGTLLLPAVILSIIGNGHTQDCGCPTDWLHWSDNNRCYFSSIRSGAPLETFFGARRRCQEDGGDLAIMSNDHESRHVRGEIHNTNSVEHFWIGACWSHSDRRFENLDGSEIPAAVNRGDLSGNPAFGAAVMTSDVGKLFDGNPYNEKHYVCQKEYCSRSVPTTRCNEPQQSTVGNMDTTEDTVSETKATNQDITRRTLSTSGDLADASHSTVRLLSTSTHPSLVTADEDKVDDGISKDVFIGIGVGVFLVLFILCVLIACIMIWRKRRKRKAKGDYPRENNLNMDTKRTDQPPTNNMLTGHTNPSDKLTYEESGYAEVNGQPNEAAPGRTVAAKDVVYDTATAIDIGVARKQDTNDVALYATPVRVRGNTEKKEEDDDSSDEESTQIVENTIYGE